MHFIIDLWMPIVLSAVIVFFASSVLWMATPLHKRDFSTPPDENGLLSLLRAGNFAPGKYYVPWCSGKNFKDPEHMAKVKSGPWGLLIVPSAAPSFGRALGQWFVYQLLLAVFIAYAAKVTLPMHSGVEYLHVFRAVGAIALVAHAGMAAQDSIWHGVPWRITIIKHIDGIVYALLTAGVYGWLWPR